MDQKRIIDEFKELVSIEVHSRDERAIADVLKEKLTALGLTVTEDKAGEVLGGNTGNLYAQLPGSTDGEPVLRAYGPRGKSRAYCSSREGGGREDRLGRDIDPGRR